MNNKERHDIIEIRENIKVYNWLAFAFGTIGIIYMLIVLLSGDFRNLIIGGILICFSLAALGTKERYINKINNILKENE